MVKWSKLWVVLILRFYYIVSVIKSSVTVSSQAWHRIVMIFCLDTVLLIGLCCSMAAFVIVCLSSQSSHFVEDISGGYY